MPMLIGIDASRADHLEKTGVEWYAWHLIQALKQLPAQEAHTWLLYSEQALSQALGDVPLSWHQRVLSWPLKRLWTQARLSVEMLQHKPDVLFIPAHTLPRVIPRRSVATIHDVGFFRHPELYSSSERLWQKLAVRSITRRATRILTVSEYSKQEIVQFCQVNPDRITVTYPGVDHLSTEEVTAFAKQDVMDRYRIQGPYFLYLGRLETKKNVATLVEAFRRYKEDRGLGDPVCLVLAGTVGDGYAAIQEATNRAKLGTALVQTGYVSEEDKRTLIAGALALVHPAWYEGFGFTPVEALRLGCPVICARVGSLPEVVGVENAVWFEPSDPEALAQALDRTVRDEASRLALIEEGRRWVTRYSWEVTAKQTLAALTDWS